MSCILRVSGSEFDVDDYLSKTDWTGIEVRDYRKGERVFPNTRVKREHIDTGFGISVSDAAFEDFEKQQEEVIAFIKKYKQQLELLKEYKIDRWHSFDFGLRTYPSNRFSRTYYIENELCQLVGDVGLEIVMSNYFTYKGRYLARKAKKRWLSKKYKSLRG